MELELAPYPEALPTSWFLVSLEQRIQPNHSWTSDPQISRAMRTRCCFSYWVWEHLSCINRKRVCSLCEMACPDICWPLSLKWLAQEQNHSLCYFLPRAVSYSNCSSLVWSFLVLKSPSPIFLQFWDPLTSFWCHYFIYKDQKRESLILILPCPLVWLWAKCLALSDPHFPVYQSRWRK